MRDPLLFEPWIRGAMFFATIAMLISFEKWQPRRPPRGFRQSGQNIGLFVTNTVVIRLISATSVAGIAAVAASNGWGLLNRVSAPAWLELVAAVVALDFSMYVQHRVFHWVPWLWRLHAVHHSDTSLDVTTGVRFHIGEILVSFALKTLVVLALGASIWAVIVFEALLSSASLFTHSNVRFSTGTDAALRSIVVTPDVHLVHHSAQYDEHNCNFGFLLIWWDRLFSSYRTMPRGDPQSMPIGLSGFRDHDAQRLGALLIQPFSARPT
jgi:sterol desaturase/sphingolipid hydroxylase (fatty acid hydroxylase superfamily)